MNLKNNNIKTIKKTNLNKLVVIFVSFIFTIGGLIVILPKINSIENPSITWEVTLNLASPDSSDDTAYFGEAPDANDGPPYDIYDQPLPPAPFPPNIRTMFDDGMQTPYDKLTKDYRSYPDTNKIWNLSVQWFPTDSVSPTTITITWSTSEISSSEYDSVLLYKDGIQVKDMLTQNSYSYTASAITIQTFQIICNKTSNSPPNIPSNPNPYDGETNVDVNADLSWKGGDPDGDPITYDIYFSTTIPTSKQVSNQSGTSFDPGTMDYDETYYWNIVAWDNNDASTYGPTWSFTTKKQSDNYSGDMDGNGLLNAADCRYLARHIVGDPLYSELHSYGDVDSSSSVNAADCRYLARHIVGDPAYDPLYPNI
jgi:hypothetical protein